MGVRRKLVDRGAVFQLFQCDLGIFLHLLLLTAHSFMSDGFTFDLTPNYLL